MYNHIINFWTCILSYVNINLDFLFKHSTQQVIITLVNKIIICLNFECDGIIIIIFLKIKKAFDTMDHNMIF